MGTVAHRHKLGDKEEGSRGKEGFANAGGARWSSRPASMKAVTALSPQSSGRLRASFNGGQHGAMGRVPVDPMGNGHKSPRGSTMV